MKQAATGSSESICFFRLHAFAILLVEILQILLLLAQYDAIAKLQAFEQLLLVGVLAVGWRGRLGRLLRNGLLRRRRPKVGLAAEEGVAVAVQLGDDG